MRSRWAAASDCSRRSSVSSNCSAADRQIERWRPHSTKEPSPIDGSFFSLMFHGVGFFHRRRPHPLGEALQRRQRSVHTVIFLSTDPCFEHDRHACLSRYIEDVHFNLHNSSKRLNRLAPSKPARLDIYSMNLSSSINRMHGESMFAWRQQSARLAGTKVHAR